MNSDPASLGNLRDIVEPAAVSWWPPAPGWWILLAILVVAAAIAAFRLFRKWKANAYRRAALAELESAATSADISALLKRTALVAFPRTDVASLSGNAWSQWLGHTSDTPLTDSVRQCLSHGVYQDTGSDRPNQLKQFASAWIRGHRSPKPGGSP